MFRVPEFPSKIVSLWFRLITLGVVALVFTEALILAPGKAQGWTFYLSPPEVAFEVVVRLVAAALAGVALGSVCTAAVAPFLWVFPFWRERVADWTVRVGVVAVVFFVSQFALQVLIRWSYTWWDHKKIFDILLWAAFYVAVALALCFPSGRKQLVTSLDGFLGNKVTRRTALATVGGAAALIATEFVLGKAAPVVRAAAPSRRPKNNFLLITFDALNAEDMSLYGRSLPTTPNIDAFARKGTVFTGFYSASTFTTPSVATMMTGIYPSQSRVYQLQGQVRAVDARNSLPYLLRSAGYVTGAVITNPWAYYLGKTLQSGFDVLPDPVFQPGGLQLLWEATNPLHQDSGFGCRIDEYFDLENLWNSFAGLPSNLSMRMRPHVSFERAQQVLANLPEGFFFWIHLVTPHNPYLPDSAERGRFLPDANLRTYEEQTGERWKPHYLPNQQEFVDQRRLRYDEFIATADRAFGTFIANVENRGILRNTTVIISADHGESFEGGVYQHSSPYLTRPVIHIPLVIRMPGQQEGHTVAFIADQTALAPTVLELAGQPKPASMRGASLVEWLNRTAKDDHRGLAFTQYFEKNSEFGPLRHGTVGVIDGQYQYVYDLDARKGALRPLSEAQIWNLDRTEENPSRAEALRKAILAQFPGLQQTPA